MSISLNKRHGTCLVEGLIKSQRNKKRRATKVVLMPNQIRRVHIDIERGYDDGTVYKASNWKEIENSAGKNLTKNPKKGGTVLIDYKPTPKKTFIYRLDKSFRCNPVTKFKNVFLKRHWKELNSVAQYNYKPKKG